MLPKPELNEASPFTGKTLPHWLLPIVHSQIKAPSCALGSPKRGSCFPCWPARSRKERPPPWAREALSSIPAGPNPSNPLPCLPPAPIGRSCGGWELQSPPAPGMEDTTWAARPISHDGCTPPPKKRMRRGNSHSLQGRAGGMALDYKTHHTHTTPTGDDGAWSPSQPPSLPMRACMQPNFI